MNSQLDTQFDKFIAKLNNYKSIAKLDDYANTSVGDDNG